MCAYIDLAGLGPQVLSLSTPPAFDQRCPFLLAPGWFEAGIALSSSQYDTKGIGLKPLGEVFLHDQESAKEKVSSSFLILAASIWEHDAGILVISFGFTPTKENSTKGNHIAAKWFMKI